MTKVIEGDDDRQWWADRARHYDTDHRDPRILMQLFIDADQLRIELTWMERFWAVHASQTITIPLAEIRQVSTDLPAGNGFTIRSPGTFVPGWIKAGTYYHDRLRAFWYTKPKKPVLTLELTPDAYYREIVLTLDDNLGWRDRIQAACQN
jgi:hypothetical protein